MTAARAFAVLIAPLTITPYAYSTPTITDPANSQDPATQTQWAERYEYGEGVPRDLSTAIMLYCKAARQNYGPAQYQLGWIYLHGRGVAPRDDLAGAWLKKAAQNHEIAARNLIERLDLPQNGNAECILPNGAPWSPPNNSTLTQSENSRRLPPLRAPTHIKQAVIQLAPRYQLDYRLVLAVIEAESNFNPQSRSPKQAMGLMQLIPATADRFGVKDPYSVEDNLKGGMAYLRWLLDFFKGDIKKALAGYNAGEGRVVQYQGIPPFKETQQYVHRVLNRYHSLNSKR